MNTLSRKQREVAARHALFLDIGRRLLESDGYTNLGMDRIAELAEYSKGTVYQHFNCKEEVLIQLCIHDQLHLKSLFQRAAAFEGNQREKLMAIFFANSLWAEIHPSCMEMMQTLCGGGTKDKVSAESLEKHNQLDLDIINTVAGIVSEAIKLQEVQLPESINPVELVFGLWSTCHGGLQLQAYDLPLQSMGVRNPSAVLLAITNATLDGFQWKPLSTEFDYTATMERIVDECFADEIAETGMVWAKQAT